MGNDKIQKWDNTARSAITLQKVFGMPFYRQEKMQTLYQTPIAASTLWEQCSGLWQDSGQYIVNHLFLLAAESKNIHSDDTRVTILEVKEENKSLPKSKRKGCHTTVILASHEEKKIALFVSADKHCGENLGSLFKRRQDTDSKQS